METDAKEEEKRVADDFDVEKKSDNNANSQGPKETSPEDEKEEEEKNE